MSTTQPLHVEKKVVTQTVLTLLATGAIAVLNGLNGSQVLSNLNLPSWSQGLLITLVPTVLTALGGYVTKHSARADLDDTFDDGGADQVITA